MVDIDSETLFNGAAAVVSTIAVLFFVLNVDFGYSPVSKIALVTLFLAGVFAVTQRTPDHQLTFLGYGVMVTVGVALFFDVVNTFDVGNALTVGGLLAIAGLLFSLRMRLDEDNHFVTGAGATYAFGVVAVLAVSVLVVDVVTGGLAYELQPESEVEYADAGREEARIASVLVTNPTPFPERVEAPDYRVCTAGDWSAFEPPSDPGERREPVRAHANVRDGYGEFVFGYGTKAYPVTLHIEGADVRGETFPVRTTSACPDEDAGPPYLALFEARGDRPYGRPA